MRESYGPGHVRWLLSHRSCCLGGVPRRYPGSCDGQPFEGQSRSRLRSRDELDASALATDLDVAIYGSEARKIKPLPPLLQRTADMMAECGPLPAIPSVPDYHLYRGVWFDLGWWNQWTGGGAIPLEALWDRTFVVCSRVSRRLQGR